MGLREDAEKIIEESIRQVMPGEAVAAALKEAVFPEGKIFVAAVGKAAWQMAEAAAEILGDRIEAGIVVTKYGHAEGTIPKMKCFEGGHPVPDENSFRGTEAVIQMVSGLKKEDTVIFLLSGGGSALFEKPLIPAAELQDITSQLLNCGADITEINTVRKHLSGVKGGRFAKLCLPAGVFCIALSDVLGGRPDIIASGPACPDSSTCEEAAAVVNKYHLNISETAARCLLTETPKRLENVQMAVTGSVEELCRAAAAACKRAGYRPLILTDRLSCEAREAGRFLAAAAGTYQNRKSSIAFIAGGETVVHVNGTGKGGRNQELVLAAAEEIAGFKDTAIFSIGSDGTDGPTDAAGGYCDSETKGRLEAAGVDIFEALQNNDAYYALKAAGGLVVTGPTGTNVNDVAVVLIRSKGEKLIESKVRLKLF